MSDTKSSPKKGTDCSDGSDSSRTATDAHPRDDPRSAEKRLENAIDQATLAINQLKARDEVVAEHRARNGYSELRAARKDLEEEADADDGGDE